MYQMTHTGAPNKVIFGPDSVEITYISTGNIIAKGVANHASKEYEFSHFLPFSDPMHSQLPLERGGKNISSTYFAVYTSIADLVVSVYEIAIQGDSDPDLVLTSKMEARNMTGKPPNTQKGNTLALCHAILPPSKR